MSAPRYPRAHFIRSPETAGKLRDSTLGVVWHWTAGHEPGDVAVLSKSDPRGVNVQFYIPKDGTTPTPGKPIYQFTETDERANHGFFTANHNMVGVEMENSGEGWSAVQISEAVLLGAWLSNLYDIPIVKCDPSGHTLSTFRGHCGHRDLAGIDGNNHSDTVPLPPGWERFLVLMRGGALEEAFYFEALPYDEGGVGPKLLGQTDGYAMKAVRDARLKDIQAANPDLAISTMSGDDERFYILGWGNPVGRDWYRSANFADDEKRDVEIAKRKQNLPSGANALRSFKGKANSRYPWPA